MSCFLTRNEPNPCPTDTYSPPPPPSPLADCPMDHILELNVLNTHQQWLPRQHSFLQHEDMPPALKQSRLNVSLREFSKSAPGSLSALVSALRPGGHGQIGSMHTLVVSSIPDVYHMLHPSDQATFMSFGKTLGSLMCCTWSPKLNGFLNYDLFWDVIPHTDSVGRTFTQEWAPCYGNTKQRVTDCSYDFRLGRDSSHPKVTCGLDSRPL